MIRVFIIDDQSFFRQGIRASFSRMPDIEISGEANVNDSVLPLIEASLPDVVLLGTNSTLIDSLQLCQDIKRRLPSVATIILTSQPDDKQLFQAIKSQAAAYLSKDISPEKLALNISRCANGEHPINEAVTESPRVAEQILEQFQQLTRERETATFIAPLTPRETEILNYMAQGLLNKQIAKTMTVSEQTIKNHITSILRKLDANARTQAVVIAIKKGLITINKE